MYLLNFKKVLCLSPHRDEVIIGRMGSIIKFKKTDFDMLYLSKGGAKKYDKTNSKNRIKEAIGIWSYSKQKNVSFISSKFNYIEDATEEDWINYLDEVFCKKKYDCLFVPSLEDSHSDHQLVNKFGKAMLRISKTSLIEYQTPSSLNDWSFNFFVDIRNQYEDKINYLRMIESQKEKEYLKQKALDCFHSNFQCSKKGLLEVEKFKIIDLYC